nr:flavin reductase family protein [Rhodococcus sp. (in: high G+C Gram-positive bacteria)]
MNNTARIPEFPALQEEFRHVMSAVCTPVAVVTATGHRMPYGTTVSAFASLSMTPPMVLVSLDKGSELLSVITTTGKFGLNVLGTDQAELALNFARKGGTSKFTGIAWEPHAEVPKLPGATGFVACTVAEIIEGGDHFVVLGDVVAAHRYDSKPLTYHGRMFGTHISLADVQ